jgi:hypothetical protein
MSISIANDIFSQKEIDRIRRFVSKITPKLNDELGRLVFGDIRDALSDQTCTKLSKIAKNVTDLPLSIGSAIYVEYSPLYGKPNLPPHFDADTNDLILNIQLESNTDWLLGLNLETYLLKDNSALIFNGNKEIHWRVHKEFKEGEYVKMLFVRFSNPDNLSDYSHLNLLQDNEVFKEAREFRDSYPQPDKPKMS